MKRWTLGVIVAALLVGGMSAVICGVEGFAVLMSLGDRYRHNYEYYLWLCGPIMLISGAAGFCFPFAWLWRRGCRPEDVKAMLGSTAKILFSVVLAAASLGGWMAAKDSVVALLASGENKSQAAVHTVYTWVSPVVTAGGFAVGIWLVERFRKQRPASFLRISAWPLVGCAVGAAAILLAGPLVFSLGTGSLVVREVIVARKKV